MGGRIDYSNAHPCAARAHSPKTTRHARQHIPDDKDYLVSGRPDKKHALTPIYVRAFMSVRAYLIYKAAPALGDNSSVFLKRHCNYQPLALTGHYRRDRAKI